jgi:hypothetical protein
LGTEAVFEKLAQIEATTAFNLTLTIKCRGRAKLYLGLPDPASGRIIEYRCCKDSSVKIMTINRSNKEIRN